MSEQAAKLAVAAKNNPQIGSELFNQIMGAANRIEALEAELAASQERVRVLEGVAKFLFNRLDDVDTADDIAKQDEGLYRALTRRYHKRRWETGITTDGYTLDLSSLKAMAPEPIPEDGFMNLNRAALAEGKQDEK